jgi:acetyl coenzyme A synthetase (ADP forming)-like protein
VTRGPDGAGQIAASYPIHRDLDLPLRDGSTVRLRPVRRDDRSALEQFLNALSEESRIFRFFGLGGDYAGLSDRFTDVDYGDRYGLVAERDRNLVGHGYYARTGPDRAEVALAVADSMQGMGLGTRMLEQLGEAAADSGIPIFEAEVMGSNHRMLQVFRDSGFPLSSRSSFGTIHLEMPTRLSAEAVKSFERRDQMSAIAAIRTFLQPSSVAVIGASRRAGSISAEVFRNLLRSGFPGPVYPVNPTAAVVQSVVAYPSLADVPGDVELAVIVVPADAVVDAARACAARGVRGLVVISAGFAEGGEEGVERQRQLVQLCRETGMRLIGPNCMGVVNTDPDRPLNATFAPQFPPAGGVGFMSQSGALGLAVIDYAAQLGLGLSSFVSVGNKADISGNDLLEYWEEDPRTQLVLLYLESFGNPRRFSRIARRIGKRKPVVVVKSGRSRAGRRATSSHTGALLQASDAVVDALFAQSGVIRTETLGEMFDIARLLISQPAPTGGRVGIVTNAGGLGILCADACEAGGLEVPPLPDALQRQLSDFLPPAASLGNPVDLVASASAGDFERAVELVGGWDGIDALIVIFIPPLVTRAEDVAPAIVRAADRLGNAKPVIAVFTSAGGAPAALQAGSRPIPTFSFPEDAARALARAATWGRWALKPEEPPELPEGVRQDEARGLLASWLARNEGWLEPEDTFRLLDCYGIPALPWRIARTPTEARRAARALGMPVAVKAVATGVVHKTEAGAVRLSLNTEREVERACRAIQANLAEAGLAHPSFLVQKMAPAGVEMLVGTAEDDVFGPVLALGMGGTQVEVLQDVAVRLTPVRHTDVGQMLASLRGHQLLHGYRGGPAADLAALTDLAVRVGWLAETHAEVVEMDLNPVIATPDGAVVVDARVRIEAGRHGPPRTGYRRMRPSSDLTGSK